MIRAGVNVIDRQAVSRYRITPQIYAFFFGLSALLPLLLLSLFFEIKVPSPSMLIIALITGLIYIGGFILYTQILIDVEASQVIGLFTALVAIFVLFFSSTFITYKTLDTKDYIAFICLLGGSIFIGLGQRVQNKSHAFMIVRFIIIGLLLAAYDILVKYVSTNIGLINSLVWINVGSFLSIFGLILIPGFIQNIRTMIKTSTKTIWTFVVGGRILSLIAVVFYFSAIHLVTFEQVAFVSALKGLTPFFIFLYEQLLKLEQSPEEMITLKIGGLIFTAVGIAILNLS